jgi:hypothetical protein
VFSVEEVYYFLVFVLDGEHFYKFLGPIAWELAVVSDVSCLFGRFHTVMKLGSLGLESASAT